MTNCCRSAAVLLVLLVLSAASVSADVEVTWSKEGNDVRGAEPMRFVEWISGHRHREDQGPLGKPPAFSVIRDLKSLREFRIWHGFRFIIPRTLRVEKDTRDGDNERRRAQAVPARTGVVATILDRECHEYSVTATSADGVYTLKGTFWMPEKGPGAQEYASMYRRLGEVRSGREEEERERERSASEGRVQLYTSFLSTVRQMGIPYRFHLEVTGRGVPLRVSKTIERISTDRIPARTFEVPANYQRRQAAASGETRHD
ncbi:MAG TPA: hypothetical protein VM364_18855 [Vicinamibacterales bacterium]|nr:hypothetical protein [Vicinamibacterales bacterium]